jgi:GTP-binding protein
MSRPIIAIAGRPNVGKSTLFNRLIGERKAIIEELPGTTRDRLYADTSWKGHELTLVDMGGFEPKPDSALQQRIRKQVEIAIAEADVILLLVDAQNGVLSADLEVADILRRSQKPVALVANKVDSPKHRNGVPQFYELGMGDPIPISAYHAKGVEELLDKVCGWLPFPSATQVEPELMKIAIVGRPNVGKSMLLNTILGEDRAIVDEVPGTTRDALDTIFHCNGERIVFVDTAGIRRQGRIKQGIEQYSLIRGLQAIERADVVLLLIDATEGITAQDTHVLGYIKQAYKGVVLVVNKWDIAVTRDEDWWTEAIRQKIRFMPYVPILFTSAKTGEGVKETLSAAKKIYQGRLKHLPPQLLNSLAEEAITAHPVSRKGKRYLRIFQVTQTGVNPPTFVFIVNDAKLVHFSYQRYLENRLRQLFDFQGTPLRLLFKNRVKKYHEA